MSPENNTKTVIVTGGSRGIGRAVCIAFAAPETTICFNYATNTRAADQTRIKIEKRGGRALAFPADVTDETAVTAMFKSVLEETGQIDVLVNNAGITRDGLLVRMKLSDWEQVLSVNLNGTFICTKLAVKPMMRRRKGRIINISSVVGMMGNAGQANYSASKAGIIGFTKSMARELASRNITVNAVAPGYIDTEMTDAMAEKARAALLQQIPLGRMGTAIEVAEAAQFLASDKAAYITGQVIHVNGGMMM